ncbi:MAG: hypothetical protein KDC87_17150 [Planctomycetes bacterium]|nr:hypothetical protein [Planctomycetota bacterium]MCB9889774.1 hypothetical protein [Planctomycetota bacterium]
MLAAGYALEIGRDSPAVAHALAVSIVTWAIGAGMLATILLVADAQRNGRDPRPTLRSGASFCLSGAVVLALLWFGRRALA